MFGNTTHSIPPNKVRIWDCMKIWDQSSDRSRSVFGIGQYLDLKFRRSVFGIEVEIENDKV